jgi:hypothetical protein
MIGVGGIVATVPAAGAIAGDPRDDRRPAVLDASR